MSLLKRLFGIKDKQESSSPPEEKARNYLDDARAATSTEDRSRLAQLALSALPDKKDSYANLQSLPVRDLSGEQGIVLMDCLKRELLRITGLILLGKTDIAEQCLSEWEQTARRFGLPACKFSWTYPNDPEPTDLVRSKHRLRQELRAITSPAANKGGQTKSRPELDHREANPERVLQFVKEHVLDSLPEISADTLADFVQLSLYLSTATGREVWSPALSTPIMCDAAEAAMLEIANAVKRAHSDPGFLFFYDQYSDEYDCWHIGSTHSNEGSQYRRHILIWKVGPSFAVATSDNIHVFSRYGL